MAGRAGLERSVTLKDVAAKAGVTVASVSIVLNGARSNQGVSPERRQRILEAAAELEYQPNSHAQRLATGQSHDLVGLFCPHLTATQINKPLLVQRKLDALGLEVPLYSTSIWGPGEAEAQLRLIQRVKQQRPQALVCFTGDLHDEVTEQLESYRAAGGILICSDHEVSLSCDNVIFDREDNTYRAAAHLLKLGHRRLGFYSVGSPNAREFGLLRLQGFERALREYGLTIEPEWIFQGKDTPLDGIELAELFLRLAVRPTAMCIVNENVAAGFMNTLIRAGIKIPEQVSIVSHDNSVIAPGTIVPLTTVSQPVHAIADAVVELLMKRLREDNEAPPQHRIIQGELIERESADVAPQD